MVNGPSQVNFQSKTIALWVHHIHMISIVDVFHDIRPERLISTIGLVIFASRGGLFMKATTALAISVKPCSRNSLPATAYLQRSSRNVISYIIEIITTT